MIFRFIQFACLLLERERWNENLLYLCSLFLNKFLKVGNVAEKDYLIALYIKCKYVVKLGQTGNTALNVNFLSVLGLRDLSVRKFWVLRVFDLRNQRIRMQPSKILFSWIHIFRIFCLNFFLFRLDRLVRHAQTRELSVCEGIHVYDVDTFRVGGNGERVSFQITWALMLECWTPLHRVRVPIHVFVANC